MELGEAIARAGIKKRYYLETRGDVLLRNKEVFRFWKKLGLEYMFLGIEAIDEEGLQLYRKLQSQSAAYFSQRRTGDLLARLTADVETVQNVLVQGTDSVVANGLRDQYVSYMKGLAPTGLAQDRIDALNKSTLPSFDPKGNGSAVDSGAAVAGQGGTPQAGTTGTLPDGTAVTLNADGSITDAQGNQYDQDGNKL